MKFPTYPDSPYVAKYDFLRTGPRERDQERRGQERLASADLRNLTYTAPYMHTGTVKTLPRPCA